MDTENIMKQGKEVRTKTKMKDEWLNAFFERTFYWSSITIPSSSSSHRGAPCRRLSANFIAIIVSMIYINISLFLYNSVPTKIKD